MAVLSAAGGLLLFVGGGIVEWLAPVVGEEEHEPPIPVLALTSLTLIVIVTGVLVAWRMYGARPVPREAPTDVTALTWAARRDLYGDAANEAVFMRPGKYLTRSLVFVDNRGIDGLVNGLAAFFGGSSSRLSRLQTGFVRSYALSMVGGAAVLVAALAVVML